MPASLCFLFFLIGCLDVWIRQDLAPEGSDLMRVVDLHHVELLNDLLVDLQSSLLEWWHYRLTQVDRDQVMQMRQVLDFFVSLYKIGKINKQNTLLTFSILSTIAPVSPCFLNMVFTVFFPVVTLSRSSYLDLFFFSFLLIFSKILSLPESALLTEIISKSSPLHQ